MVKRIIELLGKEIRGLHEAAYLLAFFAFLSQVLALVRDKLLAFTFGASNTLDVYYAAFRIPDLIFVTIASMVSASVLVPFFIDRHDSDHDGGKKFVDSIFTVFFGAIVIVSIIAYIFTPVLVPFFLPGFAKDPLLPDLIAGTRILLLSPFFLGLSNFFSSITQMHRRFLVYAISPLLYNIGIIIGIVVIYPYLGLSGLMWGVALGAFLHMAIQIPFIFHKVMFPKINFRIDWLSVRKVISLSLPRTITLSANQLASFFLVALASLMSGGSISIFTLAQNLQSVPLTIIGVSYSSAVFPALSKFFVKGERNKILDDMVASARHIIFWSAPIMVLFIVLRAQIVRTIYGAGNFDWSDTRLTAATLAVFMVSVIGQSLILLFVRSYYAHGETARPLVVNIIASSLIVALGYGLTKIFFISDLFRYFIESLLRVSNEQGTSVIMLALAFSIGVLANTVWHWVMFEKDYPGFTKRVRATLFQSLGASIIMGYAAYLGLNVFDDYFGLSTAFGVFMQGFLAGIVGIIIGVLVLLILRNKEIIEIWDTLHRKFWRTNTPIAPHEAEHI
jgi:putative peptidoglycan lipid II flippase